MPTLATIETCLQHNPDSPIATTRNHNWPGVTVDRHQAMPSFVMDAPALDHHSLVYVTRGTVHLTQTRAGRTHASTIRPGDVLLIPAGFPCVWRGASPCSVRMRVPQDVLNSANQQLELGERHELRNVYQTRDAFVSRVAEMLDAELDRPEHPAQRLVFEATSCALAAHL